MTKKLLLFGIILSFSICYTEWGASKSAFIWEMQWEIISQIPHDPAMLLHPILLCGLIGQLGLVYGILASQPKKWMLMISIILLVVVVFFFLLAGILKPSFRIVASTLPFWVFTGLWFWQGRVR
jgi:hypothetical protein